MADAVCIQCSVKTKHKGNGSCSVTRSAGLKSGVCISHKNCELSVFLVSEGIWLAY